MGNKTVNNEDLELLLKRVESLESKVAFQDDTIEQLNDEITALNLNNTLMERQLKLLAEKFKETKTSVVASEAEEVPPPHY